MSQPVPENPFQRDGDWIVDAFKDAAEQKQRRHEIKLMRFRLKELEALPSREDLDALARKLDWLP